jgi:phage shock protein C
MNDSATEEKAATSKQAKPQAKKLYRRPKTGKIAGVCSGLAEYFEIDVTLLRIAFVILAVITGGTAIIVYIVMAIVMPVEPSHKGGTHNEEHTSELDTTENTNRLKNYAGIALILLGLYWALEQAFPDWTDTYSAIFWPLVLVFIGLAIILKGRK